MNIDNHNLLSGVFGVNCRPDYSKQRRQRETAVGGNSVCQVTSFHTF